MKYNQLNLESKKSKKRVGRGISAGGGKTAGRGTKGQGARTGKKLNPTFQGGSGALVRRIPKNRGFKSLKVPAQVVYLDKLNQFNNKTVDNYTLFDAGLISTPYNLVKVLLRGDFTAKITLKVQKISKSACDIVEKNGGKFEQNPTPMQKSNKKPNKNTENNKIS